MARRIREHRIDILVDCTLHMAGNRLLVFARIVEEAIQFGNLVQDGALRVAARRAGSRLDRALRHNFREAGRNSHGLGALFPRRAQRRVVGGLKSVSTALIERLASLRGVGTAYYDYRGELHQFSLETQRGILAAMGSNVDDETALAEEVRRLEIAKWRGLLPPVAAAQGSRIGFDCNITGSEFGSALVWTVHLEDGSTQSGSVSTAACPELWRGEVAGSWITRRRFELPIDLPPGYHELEARVGGSPVQHTLLVMSPPLCYEPPAIRGGARLWGVAVQLYTVRSQSNWGIGDFQDLERLLRWLAPTGAGFIGLNPLHALSPADPDRSSPYSASNRHFLNVLYIAVPAVDEFITSAAAQAHCADPVFVARLAGLRAAPLVDYAGVAAPKSMQGVSIRPWLRGETPAWRTDWFCVSSSWPRTFAVSVRNGCVNVWSPSTSPLRSSRRSIGR